MQSDTTTTASKGTQFGIFYDVTIYRWQYRRAGIPKLVCIGYNYNHVDKRFFFFSVVSVCYLLEKEKERKTLHPYSFFLCIECTINLFIFKSDSLPLKEKKQMKIKHIEYLYIETFK